MFAAGAAYGVGGFRCGRGLSCRDDRLRIVQGVDEHIGRQLDLPGPRAAGAARQLIRTACTAAELDHLVCDVAVLLTSEFRAVVNCALSSVLIAFTGGRHSVTTPTSPSPWPSTAA